MSPSTTRAIVVLPAPFDPRSASTLPWRDAERHAEQRAERSVAGVDVARARAAARPGSVATAPSDQVSRGRPCARPRRRTPQPSVPRRSACRSRARTPAARSADQLDVVLHEQDRDAPLALHLLAGSRASSAVSSRSRPDDGSSSSSSCGSVISARPISTSRPSPEAQRLDRAVGDRVEAEQLEHARRRARCSSAVGPADERARPSTARRSRCGRARRRGGARATVMPVNSSMRWNVRPIPSRARRCTGTRARSLPVEHDRAAVGTQHAEEAVEEGRLAGAVRADEPDDLASFDRRGSRRRAR